MHMTDRWSDWNAIDLAKLAKELDDYKYGVYQIRITDNKNSPFPIPRFGGTDPDGIIYIGKSDNNLGERVDTFYRAGVYGVGSHSGGKLWYVISKKRKFREHTLPQDLKLQYRTKKATDKADAGDKEVRALAEYFAQYGELPPCNSNFPRWEEFMKALQKLKAL